MKHWFQVTKRWSLAIASAATLTVGAMALLSCGGEGGPISGGGGGGGGGNSFAAKFAALLPPGQAGATYVGPTVCKTCHNAGLSAKPHGRASNPTEPYYDEWSGTMHASKNVTCENCHGPGSLHAAAASPDATTILTGMNSVSPVICAQCHGPKYDEWKSSKHSEIVTSPAGNVTSSSRCTACHNPVMRTLVLEVMGGDPYVLSGDYNAQMRTDILAATTGPNATSPHTATCVTCHNPHKKTGNLTEAGDDFQVRHKLQNTDTATNLAPPVNADPSVPIKYDHVCGECHNGRSKTGRDVDLPNMWSANMHDGPQVDMLLGTPNFGSETNYNGSSNPPLRRTTSHAGVPGQCSHCHMGEGRHTFTVSYDTGCVPCHTAADAAARVTALKTEIIDEMYALQTRMIAYAPTYVSVSGSNIGQTVSAYISLGGNAPRTNNNLAAYNAWVAKCGAGAAPLAYKRAFQNYMCIVRDNSNGVHNSAYTRYLLEIANQNLDGLGIPPAPPPGRAAGLSLKQKYDSIQRDIARLRQEERDSF